MILDRPSSRRSLAGLAALALAGVVAAPSPGARADEGATTRPAAAQPSADEVIERSIEALGGAELLENLENLHFRGSFSMPAQGIGGTVEAWEQPPDAGLVRIEMPAMGTIETGRLGDVGWSTNPMTGPRVLRGAELEQAKMGQTLLQSSDLAEMYPGRELLGREDFEGHDSWKLRFEAKDGTESTAWFDVQTGHQVGMKMRLKTEMGEIPVTVVMGEHRAFGDVTVPTRVVSRVTAMGMGIEQVLTVDTLETNVADAPKITPPAEVQALLAKEQAAGATE